jgi:hypothetical protein
MPRSKDVMLLNDLVDAVRPGEAVVVTGVYEHSFEPRENARAGFPVYSTVVTANHVARRGEAYSEARLTDEDRAEIRALARDPRVGERIAKVRVAVGVRRFLRRALAYLQFIDPLPLSNCPPARHPPNSRSLPRSTATTTSSARSRSRFSAARRSTPRPRTASAATLTSSSWATPAPPSRSSSSTSRAARTARSTRPARAPRPSG